MMKKTRRKNFPIVIIFFLAWNIALNNQHYRKEWDILFRATQFGQLRHFTRYTYNRNARASSSLETAVYRENLWLSFQIAKFSYTPCSSWFCVYTYTTDVRINSHWCTRELPHEVMVHVVSRRCRRHWLRRSHKLACFRM